MVKECLSTQMALNMMALGEKILNMVKAVTIMLMGIHMKDVGIKV